MERKLIIISELKALEEKEINLSSPLMERISSIRYDITLEGIPGTPAEKMDWDQILNN